MGRTGDAAFMEDGFLYICGRYKDLIIIRGKNYYPNDIEIVVERASDNVKPGCVAVFSTPMEGFEDEQIEVVFEWKGSSAFRNKKKFSSKEESLFYETMQTIFKQIVSDSGLKVYRIVAIQERTIPKTTSGKIKRRGTKQSLHDNTLKVVYDFDCTMVGNGYPFFI